MLELHASLSIPILNAIIELNPEYQRDFPKQLAQKGIEMVGWIGLHGEPEYLRTNINDRTKKDTGQDIIDVNLQDYFDFTMKDGSVFEKRSMLECLDNKIIIQGKKITVEIIKS